MKRRTAKILQIINILMMMVLEILCLVIFESKGLAYVVIGIACVIALWLNTYLRCPYCGAYPRKGNIFHKYCPKCGNSLED